MQNQIVESALFAFACYTIMFKLGSVRAVILSTIFFDSMNITWMSNTVMSYNRFMDLLNHAKWAINMQKICPQEKNTAEINVDPKVWPFKGEIEFK